MIQVRFVYANSLVGEWTDAQDGICMYPAAEFRPEVVAVHVHAAPPGVPWGVTRPAGPDPGQLAAEEAARALLAELRSLWLRAGGPSSRVTSRMAYEKTGGRVSHTTVAEAVSGRALPAWPTLERIVRALGGDTGHFRQAWSEAARLSPGRAARRLPV